MSYLGSFDESAVGDEIFPSGPERYRGFQVYCQDVMRDESLVFTPNEPELIAVQQARWSERTS